MANVLLSSAASRDQYKLARYLQSEAGRAVARRFTFAAAAMFRKLAAQPGMGGLIESSHPDFVAVRVWPMRGFSQHLVFYEPIAEGIQILRVMHGAQDWYSLFAVPDDESE